MWYYANWRHGTPGSGARHELKARKVRNLQLDTLIVGSIFDQARCAVCKDLPADYFAALISSDDLYVLTVFVQHHPEALDTLRSRLSQLAITPRLQWYLPSVLDFLDPHSEYYSYYDQLMALFDSTAVYDMVLAVVHPDCPDEVLNDAYNSAFSEVRQSIARRSGDKDLIHLAQDNDPTVLQAAIFDQSSLPLAVKYYILSNPRSFAASFLAQRDDISPEDLAILAAANSMYVQRAVAANPALSPTSQRRLSRSQYWEVRQELAMRNDLLHDVAIRLADDIDPEVSGTFRVHHSNLSR